MNLNLIKIYINNLKKEDINTFLINNDINLSNEELAYLYKSKNKYELIINNDKNIFNEFKNNISEENYIKLINLFNKYKELYIKK